MQSIENYEVIIIGGSYAGLSAAMALGRSLRKVLVIDGAQPCNRFTPHSHNFITHDGATPGDIAAQAKAQVLKYKTVHFVEDIVVAGQSIDNDFMIETQSGKQYKASKLIFATGLKDQFPDIKGFAECWGKSVIHCPYCHGYEYKGSNTVLIADGDRAYHLSMIIKNLTNQLQIITKSKSTFSDTQLSMLHKHQISIIEKELVEMVHNNGQVSKLKFKDATEESVEAVYAVIPFIQQCSIPFSLGCEATEMGHIQVDAFQKTNIPGIFACGDNAAMMRSVSNAVAAGTLAGAMVNNELSIFE